MNVIIITGVQMVNQWKHIGL